MPLPPEAPLPWHADEQWIIGADGNTVGDIHTATTSMAPDYVVAKHVVLCVNHHDVLVTALAGLVELHACVNEGSSERFDRIAEKFLKETGEFAPGKAEPYDWHSPITYEQRQHLWAEWLTGFATRARDVLAAIEKEAAGAPPS